MRKRLLAALVLVVLAAFPLGCEQIAAELPNAISESGKEQIATPEKFEQLEKGMSEADVVKIMGAEATEKNEFTRGDGKTESMRDWVNYDGSMIQLVFTDGELTAIKEYKVLDPNEDPLK